MPRNFEEYYYILPLILLGLGVFFSVILEIFTSGGKKNLPWLSAALYLAAATAAALGINNTGTYFGGMISAGGVTALLIILFNLSAFIVTLSSAEYIKKYGCNFGEYYILMSSAVLGMSVMASAKDLFIVFMGLELMSICFYVLAGFNRKRSAANEAALKYFLLGSFATGFIVYGIALIYGSSQTTQIDVITANFSILKSNKIFITGTLLLLVGFSFKIAAFPFHQWVPDVYQGAATTVTAFMSTAGKAAAFSVLLIITGSVVFSGNAGVFMPYFSVISVLSMLYGSIVAIKQNNIKRMLAYSSIAHAGYMIIGLAAGNQEGIAGILYYLAAYAFMNLGAFAVIAMIESENEGNLGIDDYSGLASKFPFLSALMALFMFALSGLPPFAGFFGKYYIFISALRSGMLWLAILGVLSSAISVYFYIRIIVLMYFSDTVGSAGAKREVSGISAAVISAIAVLFLGLFPGSLLDLISGFLK